MAALGSVFCSTPSGEMLKSIQGNPILGVRISSKVERRALMTDMEKGPEENRPAVDPAEPKKDKLDRIADKSASRATEREKNFDRDHNIFTK
jgi:hypothetical protein